MNKYSFVTVTYQDDYASLAMQAYTMSMFLTPQMVEEIIIVDNSIDDKFPLEKYINYYRWLSDRVKVIAGNEFTRIKGWYGQQIIKLKVANIVKTPRYIAFDGKNHLLSAVPTDFFETPGGKVKTFLMNYNTHPLRGALENSLKFFGLEINQKLIEHFPPTHTPFCLDKQQVLSMLSYLENRGTPFDKLIDTDLIKFDKPGRVTEFLLYNSWLMKNNYPVDTSGSHISGIWNTTCDDMSVYNQIKVNRNEHRPFFCLHRRAIQMLSPISKRLLLDFWQEIGIPLEVLPFKTEN